MDSPGGGRRTTTAGITGGGGAAAEKFRALSVGIRATTETVAALESAVKGLAATVATEAPRMRAELAQTGSAAVEAAQKSKEAVQSWTDQQIAMLERLKQLVIPFEGSDAGGRFSFDTIIADQIAKIRSGEVTAAQAIAELQRQFGAVYGTLQRRFAFSDDPEEREFAEMLERFINSGVLL